MGMGGRTAGAGFMTDRRAFLRGASLLLGSAALPQVLEALAAGPTSPATFDAAQFATLRALVDTILPETDSPAASAAGTHFFIDRALPACASEQAQRTFRAGLDSLVAQDYASLPAARQDALLAGRAAQDVALPYDESFFLILKDFTLTGYFLSEAGATQALAYERVPGGFQGDLPLVPGQKAWAT